MRSAKNHGQAIPTTIVVVEDEPLIGMMMADVLAGRGHEVQSFASAEKALSYLAAGGAADLLFSDVNLAGDMDGALLGVLARQLRPCLPVALTSGRAAPDLHVADSLFIAKPYDPEDAAGRLEKLMATAPPSRLAVG